MPERYRVLLKTLFTVLIVCLGSSVHAQATTDFLVQEVCADSANKAIFADPANCPTGSTARKLQIGESLPYHKIDYQHIQISDSFPIADVHGISKAVQTYYFGNQAGHSVDPAWNADTEYFQFDGGYNIIGADQNYIFFRGTWDGGGGWQPWWDSSCQTKGWTLLPNAPIAGFGYGGTTNPENNTPQCTGVVGTASVEWNIANVTYEWQSPTNSTQRTLLSLYDFHFGANYDFLEVNYFTREYGVTRWEAWSKASGQVTGPGPQAMAACPHANFTSVIHGFTMYMQDCRDWSRLVQPSKPWNPAGTAENNINLPNWPVDPLYTSDNLLQNTHFQSSPPTTAPSSCVLGPWQRSYTNVVVNWGWDTNAVAPMHSTLSYNCVLQFSLPGPFDGTQSILQQQSVGSLSGSYSFGVMLWSAWGTGTVAVKIIGRDLAGNLTDNAWFEASVNTTPRVFAGKFNINPNTRTIFFAMYPETANVGFDFNGAWIAKVP